MARVVLDSSVVLALFEPDDVHHASAVTEITQRRSAGDRFGQRIPALRMPDAVILAVTAVDGAIALTCNTDWPRYYDRAVVLG